MTSSFKDARAILRRPGFTLLETMLAVAMSALLIGLIGAGMRIYTNVIADRRADVVNAQLARVLLQIIAADIQGAYLQTEAEDDSLAVDTSLAAGADDAAGDIGGLDDTADTTETGDPTADLTTAAVQPVPGMYGNANELQIDVLGHFAKSLKYDSLILSGVDPMSANLLSDPKVVTYYIRAADDSELSNTPLASVQGSLGGRKTVLVRRVRGRAQAIFDQSYGSMQAGGAGEQFLSDQVVSIEFAYHDGYDWLDSWDSSVSGLPVMVNITLTVIDVAATDEVNLTELTDENVFQLTVRLPTAEPPTDDATGL